MSRYVDLEGLTWDGTKISSKIQEVETKHGFMMQGITIGWLWGDSVPHIDLDTYEEQIRTNERTKVLDEVYSITISDIEDKEKVLKIQKLVFDKKGITNSESKKV